MVQECFLQGTKCCRGTEFDSFFFLGDVQEFFSFQVFCGATFTIAITELGVYLWGQTKRTGEANMYPKPLQDLFGWEVRDIGCSATSIVVAADRSVIAWGPSPTYGELVCIF